MRPRRSNALQWGLSPGSLILFAGPPCAGKSTLAAAVAARRSIPHLQMDATRVRILPDAAHTRADRRVAYRAMHFAAELLLRSGVWVILDAPYGHAEDRAEVRAVCGATGAPLLLIECRVSPETAVKRLRERGPDTIRLDLTPERTEEMVCGYRYTGAGLLVDTEALKPGECLARIEEYLNAGLATPLEALG